MKEQIQIIDTEEGGNVLCNDKKKVEMVQKVDMQSR